ncbi:hypothetical protein CVD25_07900 [Bacillus canaveralius]|uniref:DNA-binding protein n=2 Tax=Bacillaceae TaxID=186817 RepID=A0A2N5GS90_9BACI|nr:hypothetical protein CVD23_07425 [Bacillus sp. V33-4]PLR86419.1 hypothetical protein CU635_02055 [Bacillus canaveralius]PLR98649.1 hypothetical protein CVD25_07900 [Bacillus canaveralius]RSK54000.1 hypothetical protein EJA13_06800 [Bacillus canaveralius]
MELHENMEFEMKSGFMPNLSNSDRLKILEVTQGSIVIKMDNSNYRGVFPRDSFQYWIKKGSLVHVGDNKRQSS